MPKRAPYTAVGFGREGWNQGQPDSDPFAGDTGQNPWPGIYTSYGPDRSPTGEATLTMCAGMEHVNQADQDTASNRHYGMPPDTGRPIITATSRVFAKPTPYSQPSNFFSGTQYPFAWSGVEY